MSEQEGPKMAEIADALGISRPRVTQLAAKGMPTTSIEEARAWRARELEKNQRAGHVAQPVRPMTLDGLDSILNNLMAGGEMGETEDKEMDTRIAQQAELCRLTRESFLNAMQEGDPAQGKLYGNYDKAVATLLRLEKERTIRLQERGRLIDADEAAVRYGRLLGQLRQMIERGELTFAPRANPNEPAVALVAYREFRDDLFSKLSEYSPVEVSVKVSKELGSEVVEKQAEEMAKEDSEDLGDWEAPPDA